MTALSNFSEDLLLTFLLTTDAISTRPTAWYLAIHTSEPDEDGVGGELSGGADFPSYVRQTITFPTPTPDAGQVASDNAPSFTCDGTGFTATHVSIWDASTGGSCLLKGQMIASKVIGPAGVLTFTASYIVATIN